MTDAPVVLSLTNGHARITLNRPERRNALTGQMLRDLAQIVQQVVADERVRLISLTGAGAGFCAGQDLSERDPRLLSGPLDLEQIQHALFHPVILALAQAPKPVVACVNGVAAGAGVALALAADIVIAADSAKLAFSFARVGLSVDAGLGRVLVNSLGPARAKALLMLGQTLSAPEAAACGLIYKAVPDDLLAKEYARLVQELLASPPTALRGIKTALAASHLDIREYLSVEAAQQGMAGRHPDYAEAVLAFLEKRPPRFS